MRIDIDAEVVDRDGQPAGRLHELVFERESRRVAGFLILTGGGVPREVSVMPGQVGHVEQTRLTLTLSGEELARLPDARQRLYVAPEQDLEAEVAAAESETASPDQPDPDERPAPSAIPGVALLPNLMIPIEVERSAIAADHVALGEGLRIVTADGEELGHPGGVVINDDAQLVGLVVREDEELVIGYDWLDQLDEDAGEVTLTVDRAGLGRGA